MNPPLCEYYTGPANRHGDRAECGKLAVWLVADTHPLMYLCDEHAKADDREPGPLHALGSTSDQTGENKT